MSTLLKTPLTMSSREIADLTGKRHDNVIRDIEKMLSDIKLDHLNFEGVYLDGKGEQRKCYNLPKNLTITLIAGYRADLRLKIVNKWMELEEASQQRVPKSFSEALKLAAEQAAQLEVAIPKATAFDELANTEGLFTLRDSAKLCGWPERRFTQKLLQPPIKWLYVQTSSGRKLAYAEAIKAGYMDVKQVTIFHKNTGKETYGQPMITQKGLTKLAEKLGPFVLQ